MVHHHVVLNPASAGALDIGGQGGISVQLRQGRVAVLPVSAAAGHQLRPDPASVCQLRGHRGLPVRRIRRFRLVDVLVGVAHHVVDGAGPVVGQAQPHAHLGLVHGVGAELRHGVAELGLDSVLSLPLHHQLPGVLLVFFRRAQRLAAAAAQLIRQELIPLFDKHIFGAQSGQIRGVARRHVNIELDLLAPGVRVGLTLPAPQRQSRNTPAGLLPDRLPPSSC